jgi:hypothetical protein
MTALLGPTANVDYPERGWHSLFNPSCSLLNAQSRAAVPAAAAGTQMAEAPSPSAVSGSSGTSRFET